MFYVFKRTQYVASVLTNVQTSKFAFSRTNFVLLALILSELSHNQTLR